MHCQRLDALSNLRGKKKLREMSALLTFAVGNSFAFARSRYNAIHLVRSMCIAISSRFSHRQSTAVVADVKTIHLISTHYSLLTIKSYLKRILCRSPLENSQGKLFFSCLGSNIFVIERKLFPPPQFT